MSRLKLMNFIIGFAGLLFMITPCSQATESVHDDQGRSFELGATWQREIRDEYGSSSFTQNAIEVNLLKNWKPLGPLALNFGGRAGFAWQQPEQAQSLRIREIDFRLGGETSLTYPWVLRPALRVGAALLFRSSKLLAQDPVSISEDPISSFRALPLVYAQLGVGVILFEGAVGLEPYLRRTLLIGDPRMGWSYGLSLNGYF